MNKVVKVLGVGLVSTAVVGLVAYIAKKVKDVDRFDNPLSDDSLFSSFSCNEDDLFSTSVFDTMDDDFKGWELHHQSPFLNPKDSGIMFCSDHHNMSADEVVSDLRTTLERGNKAFNELQSLLDEDDAYGFDDDNDYEFDDDDEFDDGDNGYKIESVSALSDNKPIDVFSMLNSKTREEVIDILLSDDIYASTSREDMESHTDGELTQMYVDYKLLRGL